MAQLIEPGRSFFPAALAIEARAVVSEEHIAVMLQWNDMSAQVIGRNGPEIEVPLWLDDTDTTQVYSDAVAVQFSSNVESGRQKPYFLFGDVKRATEIWLADLSETEPWHYLGRGSSLLQVGGPDLDMWSGWDDGQWTVIFRRTRKVADHTVFEEGMFIPVAFSVWDGFSRERGNRRGVTSWYHVYVEPASGGSPVLSMLVLGLMTLLVGVFATIHMQWKFLRDEPRGYILRENESLLRKSPISKTVGAIIQRNGLSMGIWKYRQLKNLQPDTYDFSPGELVRLGDSFLRHGNVTAGLALLHLNLEIHPGDPQTLDCLGKAYVQAGERKKAIACFERSVAQDPVDSRGRVILKGLERI